MDQQEQERQEAPVAIYPGCPAPTTDGLWQPMSAFIAALLFLVAGYFVFGGGEWDGPAMYVAAMNVVMWATLVVGYGLLVVAGLEFFKLPIGLYLDFPVSIGASVVCLASGGVLFWVGFQLQGALFVIFGVYNAGAAKSSWARVRLYRAISQQQAEALVPGSNEDSQ